MGMFLAVGAGLRAGAALHPPDLQAQGARRPKKKICFIGKGVTFDSGGCRSSRRTSMEDMKIDMSGAAAVISAMDAIADARR